MNNLKATKRDTATASQLNKLRAGGSIPAILYGGKDPNAKISIEKKLIITDSIDNSLKIKNNSKIEVISIGPLMAEAINRISNSTSVSDLFN